MIVAARSTYSMRLKEMKTLAELTSRVHRFAKLVVAMKDAPPQLQQLIEFID